VLPLPLPLMTLHFLLRFSVEWWVLLVALLFIPAQIYGDFASLLQEVTKH
jgi:hypothetical protein